MVESISPTPYPEVNLLLQRLLTEVKDVLGKDFVGLYVHGSLAYGGFNPETSDVDFLVATRDELGEEQVAALADMHARLAASGLKEACKMEGSYIPIPALRRYDPDRARHPALSVNGSFGLDGHGSDWILQRWILRERGIPIAGPAPSTLIDPVGPQDLRRAVRESLREWWSPPFPRPARFETPGYRAYAVLTMCRSLYLLEHGRVSSKPEAAGWVIETLGEPWAGLAAQAAAWREGLPFPAWEPTQAFILFTLDRWGLAGRT